MDLEEAETIFIHAIEADVPLVSNLTLIKKFVASWLETESKEVESVSLLLSWYRGLFLDRKNVQSNENNCILALIILENLLNDDYFNSAIASDSLFSLIIRPLHEMVTCYHFGRTEQIDVSIEIILSFYKIHLKLSENAQYAKQVKKYGLWKEIMIFYLENNKFSFPIQNICTEYLNNLLLTDCMPDELLLLLDILTSNAKIIKTNVETNCYNDQIIFRSFRLLNHVLMNSISRLNLDAFNLISRKCHFLNDSSLKIAYVSKNVSVVKYALYVHVLLKYCAIVGSEQPDSQFFFDNLIHSIGDTLIDIKFFKYLPEVFCLLEEIFRCPAVQNLWIRIRVITCDLYLQRLSFTADLPPYEGQETSEKISHFYEKYRAQLMMSSDLPDVIDSMWKLMCNSKSRLNEDQNNYLIRFMNCILKSFVHFDGWLSGDLCNLLINVIHGARALLTDCDILRCNSDIFEMSISVCKLKLMNRMDVTLAAYNLCHVILRKKSNLSKLDVKLLKQMMIDSFQDTRWEVRDCALELWADILSVLPTAKNDTVIVDQQLFEIFAKAVFDDESYVRATAYKVLSRLISLPNNQASVDYESLLSQTITKFPGETECNVRVIMTMFIQVVWENHKITNVLLLRNVYETIYYASSVDIHDEVRLSGMCFWDKLVRSFVGKNQTISNYGDLFDGLANIGCLQALTDALEDEYDLQITEIAIQILELLLTISLRWKNCALLDGCHVDDLATSAVLPVAKDEMNENIVFVAPQLSPNVFLPEGHSAHYINRKDFLSKYGKTELEQIKNNKLSLNETLNLEYLLNSFKKVTFEADINEKDCY